MSFLIFVCQKFLSSVGVEPHLSLPAVPGPSQPTSSFSQVSRSLLFVGRDLHTIHPQFSTNAQAFCVYSSYDPIYIRARTPKALSCKYLKLLPLLSKIPTVVKSNHPSTRSLYPTVYWRLPEQSSHSDAAWPRFKSVALRRDPFCPSRHPDIRQRLEPFWIVTLGLSGGLSWHLINRSQRCYAKYPIMNRTVTCNKELSGPKCQWC